MARKNNKKMDFSTLSLVELQKLSSDLKGELREMRFNRVLGSNFNLVSFRSSKKRLARIMTVISILKLGAHNE